jgi:acetolactate synthase-1/2/3 large subunit
VTAGVASCGEQLLRYLEHYGIDSVFGIPGHHTVQLYRGLTQSTLRHVSPRHEQGAVFMADGYARACGRPAACFLISGPGLGNAVTPMMQALADSVPILVISAVAARPQLGMGEGRLHELPDQRALASQCTRFSHTLMAPEALPRVLARAFAVFDAARPGPVHIELPLDVIAAPAGDAFRPWPRLKPPGIEASALAALADRLRAARAPCLLLGGGAVHAAREALTLAERLDMPVVTTVNAKGIAPRGHPLATGGSPSQASVRALLKNSDCVLAVGTEFAETDYDMLFLGDLPALHWLARIDIDAAQFSRNIPADLAICADARAALSSLLGKLPAALHDTGDGAGATRVASVRAAQRRESHYHGDMQALFDTIHEAAPGLVLVGDSTLPTYYAVWQFESTAPRRYFHSATGAGTLGFAIPAAIGAKRASPDRPVLALIGDGGAQFTFMELAAAVQEKLPIIVLLWNNNGYGEIQAGMRASGVDPVGVDIDAPDFLTAARALGCEARRVAGLADLASSLRAAQAREVPTLLELREDDFLSAPAGGWYEEAASVQPPPRDGAKAVE